jgi:copper chaperone CopZ
MPDVALVVRGLAETGESERLEKVLGRLGFVEEVNVDQEKGLAAVSYEGGEAELDQLGEAIRDAGYEFELSPGAGEVAGD